MSHPQSINIDGQSYVIGSEAAWADVTAQLDNLMRTGRILLRIQSERGEAHVLVTDGTSLNFWIKK